MVQTVRVPAAALAPSPKPEELQAEIANTLELGGYQPGTMLLEWEIFWRRKGASHAPISRGKDAVHQTS